MSSVRSELRDFKKLVKLLCMGKGSLSDYLLVASNVGVGVLIGWVL